MALANSVYIISSNCNNFIIYYATSQCNGKTKSK